MMKLSEIFDSLAAGEFSQLALGGKGTGTIPEDKQAQVLTHLNLGLTDLFTRFPLKEGRLTLVLQPGQATYRLSNEYATSNTRSREPVRFISDSVSNPFRNDLMKVERVLAKDNYEMGLNDESDFYSCFTPSANTLRVPMIMAAGDLANTPDELKVSQLTVVYRANHVPIVKGVGLFPPERVVIDLPYTHLQALLYFIASRVHNPVGMSNEFHASNSYAAKYEAACKQLERSNVNVDQGRQNDRLRRNGWV